MNVTLHQQLHELLTNFRYQSLSGRGERGLMPHHIAALEQHLLPFIQPLAEKAARYENLETLDDVFPA